MRNLNDPDISKYRLRNQNILRAYGGFGDQTCGVFLIPSPYSSRHPLRVVASCDGGWEHVSVSTEKRPPMWSEMEFIKRMFFEDVDCLMQLHVPLTEHINVHPNCLHLWRPTNGQEIPRPPAWMVG